MFDTHKTAENAEYPDQDTKEIVEEMEKDKSKSEPEPAEEKPAEDEPKDEPEGEDKPEPKDEDEEKAKAEDDPDKEPDEDDDEDDDLLDEDGKPKEFVPLKKYMQVKHKLKEAKKAITTVKEVDDNPDLSETDRDKKLEAIATKWGTDPEFVKELAKTLDISPKLKEVLKEKTREVEIKHQDEEYENEFSKTVLPLIKSEYGEDVSQDVIKRIKNTHKKLSFSKALLNTPADLIYNGVKDFRDFGNKVTAEDAGNSRTKGGNTVKDFKGMSLEEATKTLSDEDFARWSDYKEQEEKDNRSNNN